MTIKASVPTCALFDVIESGLEAVGELVAINQVSVECRGIEAGACVVEEWRSGEDGWRELLVEHEVRKGVVKRKDFAEDSVCVTTRVWGGKGSTGGAVEGAEGQG